jgi:hypothetical protein
LADFGSVQGVLGLVFVADVQVHQVFSDFGVTVKVGSEGNAGSSRFRLAA